MLYRPGAVAAFETAGGTDRAEYLTPPAKARSNSLGVRIAAMAESFSAPSRLTLSWKLATDHPRVHTPPIRISLAAPNRHDLRAGA